MNSENKPRRVCVRIGDEIGWITVHPNGPGTKGTPVKLNKDTGEVLAGLGGKFNGRHISALPDGGRHEQHGAQAVIARSKVARSTGAGKTGNSSKTPKYSVQTARALLAKHGISVTGSSFLENEVSERVVNCLDGLLSRRHSAVKRLFERAKANNTRLEFGFAKLPTGTMGVCTITLGSLSQKVLLSTGYHADMGRLSKVLSDELDSGYCMPHDEQFRVEYTVSHETGHLIHNQIINERFLEEKKKYKFIDYLKFRQKELGRYRKTIIEIVKSKTGLKTQSAVKDKYLSEYGTTSPAEFFAECYANAVCGKPNELGVAMNEFLEKELWK